MIRTKWNKADHQLFITLILSGMVIYSNVLDTKREWMAIVVVAAFAVMVAHPKDFISKETASTPVSL